MALNEQKPKWARWISDPRRRQHHRFEWILMRLLLAWPIWHAVVDKAEDHWTNAVAPNGIARWVDLGFAADPAFQSWWIPLMAGCLFCYVIGFLPILATLGLLLGQVLLGTIINSLGAIHHTGQVISLVLLGQLVAHLVHLLRKKDDLGAAGSLLERVADYYRDLFSVTRLTDQPGNDQPHDRWVRYSQQFFAAGYVASGISKLLATGGEWISQVPRIALQFEKTRMSGYYDHLKEDGSSVGITASRLVAENPEVAMLFFGVGLFLELFCFLALLGRIPLLLWGIGLLILHESVTLLMGLGFVNHKWLLLILFVNLPFWIWRVTGGRRRLGDW